MPFGLDHIDAIVEKLVVDKDLAKKLMEAGFPQEDCLHYWVGNGFDPYIMWEVGRLDNFGPHIHPNDDGVYAAPTASEIILPDTYHVWRSFLEDEQQGGYLCGRFSEPEFEPDQWGKSSPTEAGVKAEMWLQLKEENKL